MAATEKVVKKVEASIEDLVKQAILTFVGKCTCSVDFINKKDMELKQSMTNVDNETKEKAVMFAHIALMMANEIQSEKDGRTIDELLKDTLEIMAAERGQEVDPEEIPYVKPDVSTPDIMFG